MELNISIGLLKCYQHDVNDLNRTDRFPPIYKFSMISAYFVLYTKCIDLKQVVRTVLKLSTIFNEVNLKVNQFMRSNICLKENLIFGLINK